MMLFTSWDSLQRILVIGVFAYVALIVMLKLTGNRTLSQLNSFDFIITIAMGSTFSSGLLDKNISLADTVFALFLLIMMQFIITKLSVKSRKIDRLVKAEPVLLFHNGHFLWDAMKKQRVTQDEIVSSMRSSGLSTFGQVKAVILETNGKLSAVPLQLSLFESPDQTETFSEVRRAPDTGPSHERH